MVVDKFNRGLVIIKSPPTEKITYLRYDGKHFWCGDKIVDIVGVKNLIRVNNKYKTGLEMAGGPFINRRMNFINKKKLISYYGAPYNCFENGPYWCRTKFDGLEEENWEPFKI